VLFIGHMTPFFRQGSHSSWVTLINAWSRKLPASQMLHSVEPVGLLSRERQLLHWAEPLMEE